MSHFIYNSFKKVYSRTLYHVLLVLKINFSYYFIFSLLQGFPTISEKLPKRHVLHRQEFRELNLHRHEAPTGLRGISKLQTTYHHRECHITLSVYEHFWILREKFTFVYFSCVHLLTCVSMRREYDFQKFIFTGKVLCVRTNGL